MVADRDGWARKLLLSALMLLLVAATGAPWRPSFTIAEGGTLILLGFARDGAVVASDSAVYSHGTLTASNAVKILKVGNMGALAISGATRVSIAKKEINFYTLATACAESSHTIESASRCLEDHVSSKLPSFIIDSERDLLVGFYLIGYVEGHRAFELLEVVVPTGHAIPEIRRQHIAPKAGFFIGFGKSDFPKSVLNGEVSEMTTNTDVQLYRTRTATNQRWRYNLAEMVSLSKTLLNATESPLAQKYVKDAFVGPPNRFALVKSKSGFQWVR